MKAIVCMTRDTGIGYRNSLPWRSKKEMAYFKEKTVGKGNNAVIMGYNTFRSLGFRPLPNRRNYIMTRDPEKKANYHGTDVIFESSVNNLLFLNFIFDEVYVIGGESIYELFEPYLQYIYVTMINHEYIVDTFFTIDLRKYHKKWLKNEIDENGIKLDFYCYQKAIAEDFL